MRYLESDLMSCGPVIAFPFHLLESSSQGSSNVHLLLYAFMTGRSGVNECVSKFWFWSFYFILSACVRLNELVKLDFFLFSKRALIVMGTWIWISAFTVTYLKWDKKSLIFHFCELILDICLHYGFVFLCFNCWS